MAWASATFIPATIVTCGSACHACLRCLVMYVSLHNRSAYSFGSSLIPVEALPAWAEFHGLPAIALTDLHGLYGAVKFRQECRRRGVRPIFGAELRLCEVDVTLLARTQRGYTHLCRLVSLHHLRQEGQTGESSGLKTCPRET